MERFLTLLPCISGLCLGDVPPYFSMCLIELTFQVSKNGGMLFAETLRGLKKFTICIMHYEFGMPFPNEVNFQTEFVWTV